MSNLKGDKLFVNLGASQTRRRLVGFGHGVRKVQTNGRNRAVVIHTAYGRSLAELKAKFADVGCSESEHDLEEPIENLRNVGAASAAWLREAGVGTIGELRRVGPVTAYLRVRRAEPQASLNLLWALVAGLDDRDWRELSDEERSRLLTEVRVVS
jgi:DNA transformation protein and related proteins